ncbi:MAG: hypothetical protein DMF78_00335 [Acidobacteria bacterium]|nr:MAG: hypothetical protein DMF78_00335 [Acidobacteriota bacterium]
MRALLAVMVVAGFAWVAVPAGADAPKTMGEAAAKEKDKKKPAKVYTEDDLHNHGRASGSYSQPAAEATPSTGDKKAEGDKKPGDKAGEKKEKTPDEERAEKQADWHKRLEQTQKDVATWQAEVDRIQSVLNDSTQPQYGPGRQAKVDALETAKKNLAAANQTLSDLQEEGRRNGYR